MRFEVQSIHNRLKRPLIRNTIISTIILLLSFFFTVVPFLFLIVFLTKVSRFIAKSNIKNISIVAGKAGAHKAVIGEGRRMECQIYKTMQKVSK